MINPQEVGRRLCALRQARGMSQQEVAALMSVTHQAVSKWETGAALPDTQILLALSRLYHTSVEVLLTGEASVHVYKAVPQPAQEQAPQQPAAEDLPQMAIEEILPMLPFLQQSTIHTLLDKAIDLPDLEQLRMLAPFCQESYLARVLKNTKQPVSRELLHSLMPFLPAGTLEEMLFGQAWQPASLDATKENSATAASRAHQALAQLDEDWINEHANELCAEDLLKLTEFARHADAEAGLCLLLEHADTKELKQLMRLAVEKKDWDLVKMAAEALT